MALMAREEELGFTLLTLEVTGNLSKAKEVLKEKEATFPVLLDDKLFSREALYVMGTPTTFIIDDNGRIRCRLVGYMENYEEIINDVLLRI